MNSLLDFQKNSAKYTYGLLLIGTESRGFLAYQPMAKRLEKLYNINYLCTDDYAVYKQIVIAKNNTTTKAETSLYLNLFSNTKLLCQRYAELITVSISRSGLKFSSM